MGIPLTFSKRFHKDYVIIPTESNSILISGDDRMKELIGLGVRAVGNGYSHDICDMISNR